MLNTKIKKTTFTILTSLLLLTGCQNSNISTFPQLSVNENISVSSNLNFQQILNRIELHEKENIITLVRSGGSLDGVESINVKYDNSGSNKIKLNQVEIRFTPNQFGKPGKVTIIEKNDLSSLNKLSSELKNAKPLNLDSSFLLNEIFGLFQGKTLTLPKIKNGNIHWAIKNEIPNRIMLKRDGKNIQNMEEITVYFDNVLDNTYKLDKVEIVTYTLSFVKPNIRTVINSDNKKELQKLAFELSSSIFLKKPSDPDRFKQLNLILNATDLIRGKNVVIPE